MYTSDIINFGKDGNTMDWVIVNDGVMGGLSQSTAVSYDNYVLFSGTTSLKNNGGFASYRSPYGNYNLKDYKAVEIKFKSTGRTFYFQLDAYRSWWNPNYKHQFSSNNNEWITVQLPLTEFKEYKVGQQTGKKISQSQLDDVLRLGIILLDKKEGPFELQIDYIKFI
ncbi:CIA30 family protein [Nonlabens ulvanivorans]|uniref:CIA30 family protein n=1 Tax=Nonlabens ulvanivorans TaxID=906888 RepID=UPI0029428C45|nr:CIA30 family protein [Nonlabens ulvanivorans]WOI23447.1 CIA30 family protein [Nonlabens ulvanivorans]